LDGWQERWMPNHVAAALVLREADREELMR
jgi:hypothetical protein